MILHLPNVVCAHDDQIEEVPHARVGHVLEDELPDEVVGVVPVAVEEGRQQAQKLQLLQNSLTELTIKGNDYTG